MPLSEKEISGFYGILCFIQDSELISLANTVSHNILNSKSRKDAVEVIIKYTNHPFELFKRKKIKKDALFLYADKFKIEECLPSDTKKELIRKILSSWNSSYDVEEMEDEDIPPESPSPQPSLNFPQHFQPQLTYFQPPQGSSPTFQQQQQLIPTQQHSFPQQYTPQNFNQNSSHNFQPHQGNSDLNCWHDSDLQASNEDRELSSEFCKWFYLMLNNLNNNTPNNNTDTLTPNHFFHDCKMTLLTEDHSAKNTEVIQGCELVCARIRDLSTGGGISYNPNLSERGLKSLCDRFGRRVVVVAGTIHSGDNVGLFEQQFGLLRDGNAEYNWKIKSVRLALSNHTPQHQISLENTKQLFSMLPHS